MTDKAALARRIGLDMVEGVGFTPYAGETPRSIDEAYDLQDAVVAHLIETGARGAVAGWKIAANSQMLLDRFGLKEPASGRVFADQMIETPAELMAQDFTQFAYEPEIAAVMGETLLPGDAPFDRIRVQSAIDRFVPSLELLDMRGVDAPVAHMPDVIAQNITNAGAVLGGPGLAPDLLKSNDVRTVVTIDGMAELDVTGAAPQDPVEAVVWIANHLAARQIPLESGQVVLCGTHAPIRLVEGPAKISVAMSGLGTVTLNLR